MPGPNGLYFAPERSRRVTDLPKAEPKAEPMAERKVEHKAEPVVEIRYCRQCRWLLRAGWMAQELLATFEDELGGVTLVPGSGGIFEVRMGAETIWSRQQMGRFPEIKELKQLIRDRVAPERKLGHSDSPATAGADGEG